MTIVRVASLLSSPTQELKPHPADGPKFLCQEHTHLDLHEEVPQVLLEGGDVLIQAEQTRYKHLHLGTEDETSQLLVWRCSVNKIT